MFNRLFHPATWFCIMFTVIEFTVSRKGFNVLECRVDGLVTLPEFEFSHARSIHNERTLWKEEHFTMCGGVTSFAVMVPYSICLLYGSSHQAIDQSRFTDT